MSRFQASTNAVLDAELDALRRQLGLRPNQKADLLRELTSLAAWVVRQASAGRTVVARGEDDVRQLDHPAIERIQRRREDAATPAHLVLDDDEVQRLGEILDGGFDPPPELLDCLARLADPERRRSPELAWSGKSAG